MILMRNNKDMIMHKLCSSLKANVDHYIYGYVLLVYSVYEVLSELVKVFAFSAISFGIENEKFTFNIKQFYFNIKPLNML